MLKWHRTFNIRGPWKNGKKTHPTENEVVLTNMKILRSEAIPSKQLFPDFPRGSEAGAAAAVPQVVISECPNNDLSPTKVPEKPGYMTAQDILGQQPQQGQLSKLECEESRFELHGLVNSPSTPTESEKSFVLHSRESSYDSGMLSASSSPRTSHIIAEAGQGNPESIRQIKGPTEAADPGLNSPAVGLEDLRSSQGSDNLDHPLSQSREEVSEKENEEKSSDSTSASVPKEEERPIMSQPTAILNSTRYLPGQQLQKYPSDSLNEYTNGCHKLHEMNQRNPKALDLGFRYLEHICQLIEKIGHLQEHNLSLQKQIRGLRKELKVKQKNEEYFLQHCSCGTATALSSSKNEGKKYWNVKERPHSLLVHSGNQSDLSIIPEIGRNGGKQNSYNDYTI
ncbi:uncharacterized protein LOC119925510 isoform X2 [Tachyglossus aculeatus]|uniref:uncharacterized protein LOC119925510 isoform X2 n=1 Tax=Tachyglossus aculeatus TaxID=9261 RepID=UPI0018F4A7AF|nr:uncharacterized protein LOC119925510 isoform X2 [Tachyglossus aculeatus]